MNKKKILLILIGESFRSGGQGSRTKGYPDSFNEQHLCFKTHEKFIDKLEEKFDVFLKIFTYNTQYNQNIIEWYSKYNSEITFFENVIGYDNLFQESISTVKKDEEYEFIFIFRIDLIFKYNFFENIPNDKIVFSSVCWIKSFLPPTDLHHKTSLNRHRVADLMIFIPKKFINNLLLNQIKLCHESCDFMTNELYSNVGFILNTYHDSDSYKDKNPLYRIANRPESPIWYSEGYELGINPIINEDKNYFKIFIHG